MGEIGASGPQAAGERGGNKGTWGRSGGGVERRRPQESGARRAGDRSIAHGESRTKLKCFSKRVPAPADRGQTVPAPESKAAFGSPMRVRSAVISVLMASRVAMMSELWMMKLAPARHQASSRSTGIQE